LFIEVLLSVLKSPTGLEGLSSALFLQRIITLRLT